MRVNLPQPLQRKCAMIHRSVVRSPALRRSAAFSILGLAALGLSPFVPQLPALAQEVPAAVQAAVLTVTGEGSVAAAPDMATISVGVISRGEAAAEALSANNAQVAALLDLLAAAGIEARDIQTSGLNLGPIYAASGPNGGDQVVSGYQVSNMVTVRVRDLDGLGALLDRIVGAGANQLNGIGFGLADPGPIEDRAREKAVAEALRKAGLLAEAAGMKLGGIRSVTEGGSYGGGPQPMFARDAMAAVPVAQGEVSVTASVSITFDLLAK
jgi:uncharacterized protein YggE